MTMVFVMVDCYSDHAPTQTYRAKLIAFGNLGAQTSSVSVERAMRRVHIAVW
jgi:hypothetical protein